MKTVDQFVAEVSVLDYPQSLEKKYDGACPCFTISPVIEGKRIYIHGHCWRSGTNYGDDGRGECGLHIKSKLAKCRLKYIARAFKKQLDQQDWYGPWHIVYEK